MADIVVLESKRPSFRKLTVVLNIDSNKKQISALCGKD